MYLYMVMTARSRWFYEEWNLGYGNGVVGVVGSQHLTTSFGKYLRFWKLASNKHCTETFIMVKCLPPTKNRYMCFEVRGVRFGRDRCILGCEGYVLDATGVFWGARDAFWAR